MQIENKFELGQKVNFTGNIGVVAGVYVSKYQSTLSYAVDFTDNDGVPRDAWLKEDQLTATN